jgi:Ca2+-binding RTX toxin-like protein
MKRINSPLLRSLARTLGCVLPATLIAGCSVDQASNEELSDSAAALGVEIASCSQQGSSGWSSSSSNLTITMGSVTSLVLGVVNGYVTVNGYACVKPTAQGGAKLTPAMVKKISITGTAGDDKVVLDTLTGGFGTILANTAGISIDLLGETAGDEFSLRGSGTTDKWSAGMDASSNLYFEISGDAFADVKVVSAETVAISLSAGSDTFTAQGGTLSATHLAGSSLTTLTPVTLDLVVNGGDGDDVVTGGAGDDVFNGGIGNDWFKASATDGDDTFNGGAGTDKMDYSGRSAALTVKMDNTTASGDLGASEADIVNIDVEDLIGGSGNDILTGNEISNHVYGGLGDDTLSGGVNAGACTADADILEGEAGNDKFDAGTATDCGDSMIGGAGTDTVDYQGRTEDLVVNVDGNALDGEALEKDNVKTDIEIVLAGSGDDTITGSNAADEIHGGPGNDTIHGGNGNDTLTGDSGNDFLNGDAGNDTFVEGGVDTKYTVAENHGDGNDNMNGGTHDALGVDKVDYSARTADIAASICMDSTKLTGAASASLTGQCADDDGDFGASEADKLVNLQHVKSGSGDDDLYGHSADDIIEGGAGEDWIWGGAGSDSLFGDDDDDRLWGDAGDDYLDSGAHDTEDELDGDNVTNVGDGDVCVSNTGDTAINCEL